MEFLLGSQGWLRESEGLDPVDQGMGLANDWSNDVSISTFADASYKALALPHHFEFACSYNG